MNPCTKKHGSKALDQLTEFMPYDQLRTIRKGFYGEEKTFFFKKCVEMAKIIQTMPKTYDQDGLGVQAIAHLHYFKNNMDWFITEIDQEPEQHQAYGCVNLGYGFEIGYISITELIKNQVELDLYFESKTLKEIIG